MRFGIPSAGMVGKQGVPAPVSSRLVCQPCFMCQLLHHCVNANLLLYTVDRAIPSLHKLALPCPHLYFILLAYTTFSYTVLA
jgi:hypothetical protein